MKPAKGLLQLIDELPGMPQVRKRELSDMPQAIADRCNYNYCHPSWTKKQPGRRFSLDEVRRAFKC